MLKSYILDMKIDSGIYKIENKTTGKIYIGQSKYLKTRFCEHRFELNSGRHHNGYLQKAFDKYGKDDFVFEVIERCDVADLDKRERYYIEKYNTLDHSVGYNIREGGNDSDMPDETKEKIRQRNRGRNNKLTAEQVEQIKIERLNGERCIDLAQKFGVTISTVNKITMCKNWEYIRSDLNEQLLKQAEEEAERDEKIIMQLHRDGKLMSEIKRSTGFGAARIRKVICKYDVDPMEKRSTLKEKVIADFMKFIRPAVIMEKYEITYPQYKRFVYGLQPKRDEEIYRYILEQKAKGIMYKDIAAELGVNRTTVRDICRRHESVNANTEITSQMAKGCEAS